MKQRILSLLLALCMAFALLPGTAFAEEPEVVTIKAPHTIAELNAKWETLKPVNTKDPYTTAPVTTFGQEATLGTVRSQVLTDGLNTLNFARYMAGLGSNVTAVQKLQTTAQYGAVMLAYRDLVITHTPEQPYGLDDDFYKKGYEGTTNCNLYQNSSFGQTGKTFLSDAVRALINDQGTSGLGHRYWILDPLMKGTGFGMATSHSGSWYGTMWVGDHQLGSGTKTTDYEAITWPVAGYHPTYFTSEDVEWSVRLNSSLYKRGDVKVTVTGPNGTSVVSHRYNKSYNHIIFEPVSKVKAGEKYTVEISGLYRNGKPTTLKYSVEFFNLGEIGTSASDRLDADKTAIESAVQNLSSFYGTNYTTAEDVLNCIWAATRYIEKIEWVSAPAITKATSSKTGSFKGTLRYSLNGTSRTYDVNITIMKHSSKDNLYRGIAAAKAMPVTASTTKADIEKFVTARLTDGCTATLSAKPLIKAPTATATGYVNYKLIVKDSKGKTINSCGITQIIPIPGREITNGVKPATPTYTANPTNDKLSVDGQPKTPAAYKIEGANYFQLRDVALLLNGTKAQFSVDYDSSRKAVIITTGQAYTPNGSEGKGAADTVQAIVGNNDVYINGKKVDFKIYKINGANFFQIRDLGRNLGFNVGWTRETGMFIESDKPYSG